MSIDTTKQRFMKRKALLLTIAVAGCLGIGLLWYIPTHTWTSRLLDGHDETDLGPGRTVGVGMATWDSMTGVTVEELSFYYSNVNDARNGFEAELKDGGRIIERSENVSADKQRAVKIYGDPNASSAKIITLSGQQIRIVKAGALKYALTFESSWLKL